MEKQEYRYKNPNHRIVVTVSEAIFKKFSARCAKKGMTAAGVLRELVAAWSAEKVTIKKEI